MQNIKETRSNGLYQAFNSSQELRYTTLENPYKVPSTIVFIDSAVDDYQSLVNGAIPEAEVIVLDSTRDGVVQITEVLQGRINIAAIHIVSHGSSGCLYLGNTQLSLDTLESYASQLQTWATPLFPSSLLLYGCNVGAGDAGTQFVERLHQLTGANIAASTNRTGSAALGGDWELEVAIGKIEVPLAFGEETTEAYTSVLAVFNVTNTNDSGAGSLRQAILDSNDAPTNDVIVFNPELSGQTITLTSGQLQIKDDLSIDGLGANNLTISGSNNSRVFLIDDGNDSNFTNVEIEGLTIANGNANAGGGIFNNENLTVTSSTISNNESTGLGAGINNNGGGTLKLFQSTVSNNKISGFPANGGLFTSGGGIFNGSGGSLEIDSSTISGNQANRGGGISNQGAPTGITSLKITNSTISGNKSAEGGGGILNRGTTTTADISFSTITNNEANIVSASTTGVEGSGGGILSLFGTTAVNNTIIAGNKSIVGNNPDVGGNFTSNGNNLIGDLTGSTGFNASEDLTVPITSVIDTTLANNGGPTQTHALVPGSPAIDAVNVPSGITTDQRGVSRPFGSNPDIGAVEFVPLFNVNNITVDTLVDENDGDLSAGDVSLREAILFSSAGGTINFDSSLAGGTITLTQGELAINKDLTIEGLGADKLTISGDANRNGINDAGDVRVFRIDDGNFSNLLDVRIDGLTIANGRGDEAFGGGGILNEENLTLTNSTISNNRSGRFGGGINNDGNLAITNSTISGNFAPFGGAGIWSGNTEGLVNRLSVSNSTISGNETNGEGGGIWNGVTSTLIVNSSTITQNKAIDGGGIVSSTVITGLIDGTIGVKEINNTIIAKNIDTDSTIGGNYPDVFGDFTTTSFNLIGDGTGSTSFTNGVNGNQVGSSGNPIDPKLGPLQNNGGSTFTHALLDGSPAIDAANPNANVLIDQRGVTRPQGNGFDIGAFEATSTPVGTPFVVTSNDDNLTLTPGNDTVALGNGQDIAQGLAGNDVLDGGDGDDRLSGGEDNDTLLGGSGQDQLFGDSGNDSLDGGDGDDRIFGGEGNDTLLGGQGQDRLFGDSGDDLLNGGAGDNTLTGGLGRDIFVLSTEGKNTIVDFEDGQDRLKLVGGLTFESLSIFNQNGDTWITTNNNQPLAFLTGVNSNLITAADFTV